jgi:EAL domain-containing protein (putative c-di-GMP-specific phosphodiesterase class I)/ActR/RegA family two-component response regulator
MPDQERPGTWNSATAGDERTAAAKPSSTFCLIVDDERGVRNFVARCLRDQLVITEEYGDASSALEALKRRTPDLIFLDVTLERSDAIEVIRGLGSLHFSGSVQLMSGRDASLLEEIKRVGERYSLRMLPVLQKPFRADAIPDVLRQAGVARMTASGPEVSLLEALCSGWVELCYQPKISLRGMHLVGAEGLARVVHPDHGVLLPGAFLPGADEGSLLSLAEYALKAALQDWNDFNEAGAPVRLAVNVPFDALMKLPIASLIRENRPPSLNWPGLILEVREEQILRDMVFAHEMATQLRIYEVHLAIDNFGASCSSFAHLRELPFVELKLARNFVNGCASNEVNHDLCKTVIQLAHRFGCEAVAEGIEAASDLKALGAMGCDIGQGFLLGRPMPKDKLCALVRQRMAKKRA